MFDQDLDNIDAYLAKNLKSKIEYEEKVKSLEEEIKNFIIQNVPENDPDFKWEYAFEQETFKYTSFRNISSTID